MYKGAVFFDVDGTLINAPKGIEKISKQTEDALKQLKSKGYLACLASGRAGSYINHIGQGFDGYITCNGAVAEIDGEVLFEKVIERDKLERFKEYAERNKIGYLFETHEKCFKRDFPGKKYDRLVERMVYGKANMLDISNMIEADYKRITKLQFGADTEEEFDRICKEFEEDFTLTAHHDGLSVDGAPKGVSKASGIVSVAEFLKIPMENTYAFGDDTNDEEMLKTVAHGVAMTPHAKVLESVAEFITKSVEEEGVSYGLKHFGLID